MLMIYFINLCTTQDEQKYKITVHCAHMRIISVNAVLNAQSTKIQLIQGGALAKT